MPGSPQQIELRVSTLSQLFNSLDPSPFHERDLDDDAETYIVGWARELPVTEPLRIVIHLPVEEAAKARDHRLAEAMSNFFTYRAGILERDLKELFRIGRWSALIGLVVLLMAMGLGHVIRGYLVADPLGRVFEEGLIILGWVANWRPAEIFLYDWWPLKRRCRLYRRLAAADISLLEG